MTVKGAALICIGLLAVAAAIAYGPREQVMVFPWGYAVKDRWTGDLSVCGIMEPWQWRNIGRRMDKWLVDCEAVE